MLKPLKIWIITLTIESTVQDYTLERIKGFKDLKKLKDIKKYL